MFELPEYLVMAADMNTVLPGKHVRAGEQGNQPHKFVWYNRTHEEFSKLTQAKTVGQATVKGRWLMLSLEPGYLLVLGECGGRILYHPPGAAQPDKYHLRLQFEDGSALTAMTQMWGAMELYAQGQELQRPYIAGMRPTPADAAFTWEYFDDLVTELAKGEKRSVKALLTQDQIIPGLGNAIAQDIMYEAHLHPKHPIVELDGDQRHALYQAIMQVVDAVTRCRGRYDEIDLFGKPGGYVRLMDKNTAGWPCRRCGANVQKIQYLGGACYVCPQCQV
jgi:formamidopyrimidine-DNA glycosylase